MIKCVKCELEKLPEEFNNSKGKKNGKASYCKLCTQMCRTFPNKKYPRNKENARTWAKEYRTRQINKTYEQEFRKTYLGTLKGASTKLYATARRRATEKNWEFNITPEFILQKVTPMICEVTGIPLTLQKYNERTTRVNPFNPSLDRRDNTKGYTQDNVQVVCWMYNLAKGDFTSEQVLKMAQGLVSKNS